MTTSLQQADSRFQIRDAREEDIPGIVDVYFHSFNAPFWKYLTPQNEAMTNWWTESFAIGLANPTDRTFVAVDTQKDNRIVGFTRWMTPQADGNLERKWADLDPKDWDMDLCGAFFGGMEGNRHELMGERPHWMLELMGVHEDYQKHGIASNMVKWGTDQADREGLETYLDASEVARPFYNKRFQFKEAKNVDIPDRPEYGSYLYVSMVRPPQKV